MSQEESAPGSLGFDVIAADDVDGDNPCTYESCHRTADWFAEATHQDYPSTVGFYVCQPCSFNNRLYIKENALYKREVSLDGK